jgi:hypothetical protein
MDHTFVRIGLRAFFFYFLAWGVFGSLADAGRWLGIMLVAEGMQFAVHTVRRWDAEEQARRGR